MQRELNATIYKSGIDWWMWAVMIFIMAVAVLIAIYDSWMVALPLSSPLILYIALLFGYRYKIEGRQLVVYQCFWPKYYPIDNISAVDKTKGYYGTIGMSCKRVSISFHDRSILKSSMPLEISPKDREGFISQLKEINPDIDVT